MVAYDENEIERSFIHGTISESKTYGGLMNLSDQISPSIMTWPGAMTERVAKNKMK